MNILGLNKTTLLDFPGHLAATIFTGGCNFRCPFCQNADLVLNPRSVAGVSEEEVLAFLKKRARTLQGICITGGEPTLEPELADFIRSVRELGLKVKLDTNGYNPDILSALVTEGLLDMVAMDIKNSREKYSLTAGLQNMDFGRIEASVDFLKSGSVKYEFRTTVVREYHTKEDLVSIAGWIQGAEAYYLQAFVDSDHCISEGLSSYSKEEFSELLDAVRIYIPSVRLRGLD